ncbi:MAG: YceI-like domain [Bacteroidetes bacterium HLUCCA01]|nr:MAG: YceI-like domain [Bacteroidetes bacterium HLUCCA01]
MHNKLFIVVLLVAAVFTPRETAGQPNGAPVIFAERMPFAVLPESRLWLEGSANVVDFSCRATEITTYGGLAGLDTLSRVPAPHGDVMLEVHIPVDKLDCGRGGINRDMKNTLNFRQHPYITYRLDRNQLMGLEVDDELFVFDISTWGGLTISGNEKQEEIQVEGKFLGPWQFRIRGSHRIAMSEFGLTPPSPMMGLIKVDDTLVVHFDVTLCLRSCDTVVQLQ